MYEYFEKLLQLKGVTATQVSQSTGIGTNTISNWKTRGGLLRADLLNKIANYFDVPMEYFLTGEITDLKGNYYLNDETAEIAQQIFENKELRGLFDAAKDSSPEDLQTVQTMLMALKRKERE